MSKWFARREIGKGIGVRTETSQEILSIVDELRLLSAELFPQFEGKPGPKTSRIEAVISVIG